MPPMLTYLASLIHLREERLDKTEIPFLRNQLAVELAGLTKRFQTEYQAFLESSGQVPALEPLRVAA